MKQLEYHHNNHNSGDTYNMSPFISFLEELLYINYTENCFHVITLTSPTLNIIPSHILQHSFLLYHLEIIWRKKWFFCRKSLFYFKHLTWEYFRLHFLYAFLCVCLHPCITYCRYRPLLSRCHNFYCAIIWDKLKDIKINGQKISF